MGIAAEHENSCRLAAGSRSIVCQGNPRRFGGWTECVCAATYGFIYIPTYIHSIHTYKHTYIHYEIEMTNGFSYKEPQSTSKSLSRSLCISIACMMYLCWYGCTQVLCVYCIYAFI